MSSKVSEARPDVKFLKDHNLMNDYAIANLITQRKMFVLKAATEEVNLEEFLKLIKLEVNVMDICNQDIDENNISNVPFIRERKEINTVMSNRIDHLYSSMFQMFPVGCVLLIEYMEFQAKNEQFITCSSYQPIIELMSTNVYNPEMYVTAASFEYENNKIEKARQYIAEGIKKHKKNKNLYLEQLWIEVQYLDDTNGDSDDTAIQIYKNILKSVEMDMEFHFLLFYKSIELKSVWRLQYQIACDLMEKYKLSDVMWHRVAKLCAEGFVFEHDISFFVFSTEFKTRARCCIETYEEGLKYVLDLEKKRNLIKLLSEYIVKIWKNNSGMKNMAIDSLVKKAMQKAFQIGHFDLGGLHKPEYYVYWAEIPYETGPEILQLAIDHNKDNVDVWVEVLEYHIENFDDYRISKKIFDDGSRALKNKALLLWEIMESFLEKGDLDLIEQFYNEGANSPYEEINMVYKVDYLSWCYMYEDIITTRELFNRLINIPPESKKLYTYMIDFEKQENQINVKVIRSLYSLACSKFGRQDDDVSLWAECIEFELTYVGTSSAEEIYNAALKLIKPELISDLKREYQLMNEAHSRQSGTVHPVVIDFSDAEE